MESKSATTNGSAGKGSVRPKMGLTGLTVNAMALIAPGAFLWLTYQMQSLYGAPLAASAMWFGIEAEFLPRLANALSVAEGRGKAQQESSHDAEPHGRARERGAIQGLHLIGEPQECARRD